MSDDLKDADFKKVQEIVGRRFNLPFHIVNVGNLGQSTCMYHGSIYRAYGLGMNWYNDFCYACFNQEIALMRQGKSLPMRAASGSGKSERTQKKSWAQG